MAAKILGVQGFVRGIADTSTSLTHAVFQNLSRERSMTNTDEVQNAAGNVIAESMDDELKSIQGEVKYKSDHADLEIGAWLTLADGRFAGDYVVKTTSENLTSGKFATYRFTATKRQEIAKPT
jgi:hypothetical protein